MNKIEQPAYVPDDLRARIAALDERLTASDIWSLLGELIDIDDAFTDATGHIEDDDTHHMHMIESGLTRLFTHFGVLGLLVHRSAGEASRQALAETQLLHPEWFDSAKLGEAGVERLRGA